MKKFISIIILAIFITSMTIPAIYAADTDEEVKINDENLKEALLQGEGVKSIGKIDMVEDIESYSFSGIFDGYNKSISNIYINKNIENNTENISIGMFSYNYGTIKNLTVSGNISFVVYNQERKCGWNNRSKSWNYSILYKQS